MLALLGLWEWSYIRAVERRAVEERWRVEDQQRLHARHRALRAGQHREHASTETSSALGTATKDAPWVNALGMKFVPVPITGGPTDGQRVLFSIWEARVQDYEVFARETKREWPRGDNQQEPSHPAVNIAWEDATAFCAWLTELERKAEKLGKDKLYRLPSDHEWSCAVGLGEQEDANRSPKEKSQKIADVFPWGTTWPPPEKAGNYWSEELRPLMEGRLSWLKDRGELAGRRDGFAETAPVGTYAATRDGLYDIGGNAWEWCEDSFDEKRDRKVTRGGMWDNCQRPMMLSSHRSGDPPKWRHGGTGFRCVLAPDAK